LGFTTFSQLPPSICIFSDFSAIEIGRGNFERTGGKEEFDSIERGAFCLDGKTGERFFEELFDALSFCLEEGTGLCVAFELVRMRFWCG
jgi:hypothetical protein